MSIFPWVVGSIVTCFVIAGFRWVLFPLVIGIIVTLILVVRFWKYTRGNSLRYPLGFYNFIVSEGILFAVMVLLCLLVDDLRHSPAIAPYDEFPMTGCSLLLGSSITLSCYHCRVGVARSRFFLFLTIFLAFCFLLIQAIEFWAGEYDAVTNVFYTCCFSTVGLHAMHVIIGMFALIYFSKYEQRDATLIDIMHFNLAVWYWHFVDVVWLFVYFSIYWGASE